ncbi:CBS domain-containing protein [Citreimonas salinaria]|uniref:CBS domain-containing protein n=1 Tax=Citreimonas salinaria TaxID=321339 RepID=A0A1H3NFH1_9RHOB|nr:CBS domain-containing protein [Citreimonas salinaria]SDY86929.1 CBS domain-containing protein [Citreimonas salinaria]
MQIKEMMTPTVDLVDPDTSIRDAAIHMRDGDVGALPVGENDRLTGMVSDRDITVRGVATGKAPDDAKVRDVMSESVYYCFEDEDAGRAAEIMADHKVRRLPVLNRDKRLVGVVAIADLAAAGVETVAIESVSVPTSTPRV